MLNIIQPSYVQLKMHYIFIQDIIRLSIIQLYLVHLQMHTFIPEASVPFVILPGLDCCCFSLILITGNSSIKKMP